MKNDELFRIIKEYEEYNAFSASDFYKKISDKCTEFSYYKAIERLNKKQSIKKISKGIYCIPEKTEFGLHVPSERELIKSYIDNNRGMIIGYKMYNRLDLTTQISNKVIIYTNNLPNNTKNIKNISIKKVDINFNDSIKKHIEMLEILSNFNMIEDFNNYNFRSYSKKFSENFNENDLDYILKNIHYKKSTIAFLKEILDYFCVPNGLDKYLSNLSTYKIPQVKEIYEFTSI